MKYEIYKDKKNFWRWRLRSRNGKIIAQGEGYHNRLDVYKIIKKMINTKKFKVVEF